MFIFENILYLVVLIFPLHIYYLATTNNNKDKNLYFEISIYITMYIYYLITKNNIVVYLIYLKLPFLLTKKLNKKFLSIIISIITIIIINKTLDLNILVLLLEYLIYFLLENKYQKKLLLAGTIMNIYAIRQLNIINIFYIVIIYKVLTEIISSYIKLINNSHNIKDNYINKLAHEIKNPLAVCKGYLEIIKNTNINHKYLDIISSELQRSITIINDFNNYSKIKKLDIEEIDIVYLLEDITYLLEPLFSNNDAKIMIETDEEIYVNADYNRLKQVFINLLKNTIEAKKEKENLLVKINIENKSHKIKITIEDNGIGMNQENLNHLYEIFYTTKPNGTGLGIIYSKEVIELHGGSIKYQSKYNVGTKVLIDIPKIDYNHSY